jgi:hypothetical protein
MRCWWCGIEPAGQYEVMSMESDQAVTRIVQWPPGNHEHDEFPPSADRLAELGHDALMKIRETAVSWPA